jgi:hypothetical protein
LNRSNAIPSPNPAAHSDAKLRSTASNVFGVTAGRVPASGKTPG